MEDWNVNITRALLEECEVSGAPSTKKVKKKGKASTPNAAKPRRSQGGQYPDADEDATIGEDCEVIGNDGTAAERLSRKGKCSKKQVVCLKNNGRIVCVHHTQRICNFFRLFSSHR